MAVQEYEEGFLLSEVPLGEGFLDLKKMVAILQKANPTIQFNLEMITRDTLKIPCLTPKYWATMETRRRRNWPLRWRWFAATPQSSHCRTPAGSTWTVKSSWRTKMSKRPSRTHGEIWACNHTGNLRPTANVRRGKDGQEIEIVGEVAVPISPVDLLPTRPGGGECLSPAVRSVNQACRVPIGHSERGAGKVRHGRRPKRQRTPTNADGLAALHTGPLSPTPVSTSLQIPEDKEDDETAAMLRSILVSSLI